jgi:hypothetical protein
MKTFIIHWHTVSQGQNLRGGYSVVVERDKRAARRAIRSGLWLDRGEALRIDRVEAR